MKLTATLLGVLFLFASAQASSDALIGEWRVSGSSLPLPATCSTIVYRFTKDGFMFGSDGSHESKKRYRHERHKQGFLVKTEHISDNAKNNCQGLSTKYMKANRVQTFYIEVVSPDELKMYFGPEGTEGFVLLKKHGNV